MGEIGIDRETFLYKLEWWEIVAITKGYRKRARTFCEISRWQTFMLMNVQADLSDTSISEPKDLLTFSWEKENGDDVTDNEAAQMLEELKQLNAKMKK